MYEIWGGHAIPVGAQKSLCGRIAASLPDKPGQEILCAACRAKDEEHDPPEPPPKTCRHDMHACTTCRIENLERARDEAIKACRLARYAFTTAIPFGTNPTARDQSRRAIDEAMAAVSTVLASHDAT